MCREPLAVEKSDWVSHAKESLAKEPDLRLADAQMLTRATSPSCLVYKSNLLPLFAQVSPSLLWLWIFREQFIGLQNNIVQQLQCGTAGRGESH